MAIKEHTYEVKLGVAAKRIFKAVTSESYNIIPKANAHVKNVDILQGDGGVGSIRQVNFHDGFYIKNRIETIDTENKINKFAIIEGGGLGDKFDLIVHTHKFEDSSDGGCVVKIVVEYHSKGDAEVTQEDIKDEDPKFLKIIEKYLIANPEACA
ncbi:pathogenesis-related protein STH-2-like [Andrographis paniculata]|uniref:pathogenesis-related protein STH-2-like n=1 Tax=Andrographis paniculata TaxID=175694 RepID=UPI0021E6E63A|nr:pathogenesis-related protein STH-2-like [Andrographis paniculata]